MIRYLFAIIIASLAGCGSDQLSKHRYVTYGIREGIFAGNCGAELLTLRQVNEEWQVTFAADDAQLSCYLQSGERHLVQQLPD